MPHSTFALAVICAALLSPSLGPSCAAAIYSATTIAPFSLQGVSALALNDRGHVAGQTAGGTLFFYDGSLHSLGKPAGSTWAAGNGISRDDVIAATAQRGSVRTAYAVSNPTGSPVWTPLRGLAGYTESGASAILPDSSAITGTTCSTGDRACSGSTHRPHRAAVWRRAQGRYLAPSSSR